MPFQLSEVQLMMLSHESRVLFVLCKRKLVLWVGCFLQVNLGGTSASNRLDGIAGIVLDPLDRVF